MKNLTINLLTITLMLLNFKQLTYSQSTPKGFVIKGTIAGLPNGTTIDLLKSKGKIVLSESSNNGQFTFKGILPIEGEVYFLRLDTFLHKKAVEIFMVNDSITVNGDYMNWPKSLSIKGSPPNADYLKFSAILMERAKIGNDFVKKEQEAMLRIDSVKKGLIKVQDTLLLRKQFNNYTQEKVDAKAAYYKIWDQLIYQHPNSLYTPRMIIKHSALDVVGKQDAYKKLTERSRNSFYGLELKKEIEDLTRISIIKVGAMAPNFESMTPEGNKISLNEVISKSKLTLIDFWGSWCKPCRGEIPNIKRVYESFHYKGFNVLGVASEFSAAAWKKALEVEQTPWFQVSQIKGRDEDANLLYDINGVPAYLLIDGDGKIVSIDLPMSKIPSMGPSLRGEGLYKTVEDILGKSK